MSSGYIRECPCSSEMNTEVCMGKRHDSANNSQMAQRKYFMVICIEKLDMAK